MGSEEGKLDGGRAVREAFALLLRRPLVTILLLELVLGIVGRNVNELIGRDGNADLAFLGGMADLFFTITSIYLQIATILAAGGSGEASAEGWLRAALRRRCFWRYFAASFLMALLILFGTIALIVGGVIVASAVVLAQPAAVLERQGPVAALRRSMELTRPARKAIGFVFVVLLLLPIVGNLTLLVLDVDFALPISMALAAVSTVLGYAAAIAFTRAFVKLGGAPAPPLQTLLYKERAGSRP